MQPMPAHQAAYLGEGHWRGQYPYVENVDELRQHQYDDGFFEEAEEIFHASTEAAAM
jgi:hypothetical protein